MPTKKELEAKIVELKEIMKGCGLDPNKGFDDYVKIGEYLYPKDAPVTLKWEGEYGEFKHDDSWYFDENGTMRERLDAWGIDYDYHKGRFVHYGGTNWQDTRTGIQAKISQSWDSLESLMEECDVNDIGLADCMEIELPTGKSVVSDLRFSEEWSVDKSHRRKYEEEESFEGSLEHELVLIPAGEFMMGALPDDDEAEDDDKPHHKVKITKDFYVGKYPVTQSLWKAVMGNNLSEFKREDLPVEKVSWFDCVDFCNKLSELEGKELVYSFPEKWEELRVKYLQHLDAEPEEFGSDDEENRYWDLYEKLEDDLTEMSSKISQNLGANGYRLLSEAEWEYAARGGEEHLYSGSNNPDEVAWYFDNSGDETPRVGQPVGQKKPNGFGLYDMSGNVFEWCWDWFGDYSSENQSDPTGPSTGSIRVYRGGSWDNDPRYLRVSYRLGDGPADRSYGLGFRLGLPR